MHKTGVWAMAGLLGLFGCFTARASEPEPLPRTEGVLRIVCFGDSITGGIPGEEYRHQHIKWTDILGGMLELELGVGKVEVLNMGFAGDRTFKSGDRPGALNRVESNILAQQPDIAVILIGGNNMGGRQSPEEAKARAKEDLTAIVRQVTQAGIKVLLLQYAEPRAENMDKVWSHLDDVNPIIAVVAEEEDVPTLELAPAFAAAAKKMPLNTLLNATDGVHLHPYGEVVVARTVAMKIQELGWLSE